MPNRDDRRKPLKALTSMLNPTVSSVELDPSFVQFAPGASCRTDGLPVDETLAGLRQAFEETDDPGLREHLHALHSRTASISDLEHLEALLPHLVEHGIADLDGQWSIDVMIEGDAAYLIDMAPMHCSALADLLTNTEEYSLASPREIRGSAERLVLRHEPHELPFDPSQTWFSAGLDRREGPSALP